MAMSPHLAFLLLPYTRAELPGWAKLIHSVGFGAALGGAERMRPEWKELPTIVVTGKRHGFKMKLDRSDWAQCSTYFLGRYYELGVQRVLDQLLGEGDTFVDVGANIGMIALHARSLVGASGRVICFEPNPACADAIDEHKAMNEIHNISVRRCALGAAAGTLTLSLTSDHSGTATLASVEASLGSMQVPVRIGDDELAAVTPRGIKIDVEGFELEVLKGLAKTLAAHKPFLITELLEEHLARAGTSPAEVADYLGGFGYKPFGISTARSPVRHDLVLHERAAPTAEFSDWLWR
jgi:FkbM family methyltransferase